MFSRNKDLNINDFILDSCKATPGFEFYCKKKKKIDISKLNKFLKSRKYFISKVSAPFFLTVSVKDLKFTIFKSLKIIIKGTSKEDKAKESFSKFLLILNKFLQG